MGLFWDLLQQSQISDQDRRAGSIEQRVAELERELFQTRQLLNRLISTLEQEFGRDIDGDGQVG